MSTEQKQPEPPVIQGEFGPTTEWARRLAAHNMKINPDVMKRVEKLIGEQKARIQYPEAYE